VDMEILAALKVLDFTETFTVRNCVFVLRCGLELPEHDVSSLAQTVNENRKVGPHIAACHDMSLIR
jgi:hypothetical protein